MRLRFINFDDIYNPKNVIANHEGIDSKTKKFNADGIFSESIFGKLDNENISYACECGKYKGKFFINKQCEECNTKVNFTEPIITRTGWIHLGEYFIINPNFYRFLTRITSKANLTSMISYEGKLNRDGQIVVDENNPYNNIGLEKFRENFDEILEYLIETSKNKINKEDFINIIKDNKDVIFINKLPVYSTTLRPALMLKDKLVFDEVNNTYNSIILNSKMINEGTGIEHSELTILPLLFTIQTQANQLFEKIIENITGKTGFIRNNILGSRVNFSARNVITPLPAGYKINDIVLPYLTFLEVYKYQILNILMRIKGISYNEANTVWFNATTDFSEEIYTIMKEIIKKTKNGCKILLNRNPTISYGSILCLHIADIKRDYYDLTAGIHNCVLACLGADYDGDTLNIIPLMDNSFKKTFDKPFNPKMMFVSSNDGEFNNLLNIDRDQILGIYSITNN